MQTVNIHEAKTQLSAILNQVLNGKSFLICKNGKPVADLIPHQTHKRTKPHPVMSHISINYDPTEPLQEDEWGEIQ